MESKGRLLENQRDALAADSLKLVRLGVKKIPPIKQDGARRDDPVRTKESQDGCSEGTFPRSRFPENAHDLSGLKTKADSVECRESTSTTRGIRNSKISNFQKGPHARMLKQDSQTDKTNMLHGEPKVILWSLIRTRCATSSVFLAL